MPKNLALRFFAWCGLFFLHIPLGIVALYAFTTEEKSFVFPPPGLTLHWIAAAFERTDMLNALALSIELALCSMAIALILGTLAAWVIHRLAWTGKDYLAFMLVLPIALPGVITGIAIRTALYSYNLPFTFWTMVVGHTTFCIVIVYNNVISRLRRLNPNMLQASADLGAKPWQTFWYVLLPNLSSAMLAGGMLAFALSFDEVIVTTFTAGQQQTLPIWIYSELMRPRQRPVVNVVAIIVILITFLPTILGYFLTRDEGTE